MSEYVTIAKSLHARAGYIAEPDMQKASAMAVVPVVINELAHVMQHLPLVFCMQVSGKEEPVPVIMALQSLEAGVNHLVSFTNRWLFGYQPAFYRRGPFVAGVTKDGSAMLSIEKSRFVEEAGEGCVALFDDTGELSPQVQQVVRFLNELLKAERETKGAVAQLYSAGVLEPWDLSNDPVLQEYQAKEGVPKGLLRVNLDRINRLDDAQIASLQRSGALFVATMQHASIARLKGMVTLAQAYEKARGQQSAAQEPENIDQMFGEGNDTFSF